MNWLVGAIIFIALVAGAMAIMYFANGPFPNAFSDSTSTLLDFLKGTTWNSADGRVQVEFDKTVNPSDLSVGTDHKLTATKQLSAVWTVGGIKLNSYILGALKQKPDSGLTKDEKLGVLAWANPEDIKKDKDKMALFNNDEKYLDIPFPFLLNTKDNRISMRLYNVMFDYHKDNKADPSVLALTNSTPKPT